MSFFLLVVVVICALLIESFCQGPAAVPEQGLFAGLDPNAASFKEEDYLGARAERARYTDYTDFLYNFPAQEGMLATGPGGQSLQVAVDQKPSLLRSETMSQTFFTLGPCGLNVPHWHPRASKVTHVLEGQVVIGFVEEGSAATARAIQANVSAGQSMSIPRGLAMWIHNLSCDEAKYLDTWSNGDPGIQDIVPSLLKMPTATVAAAFNMDTASAAALQARLIPRIPQGPPECLARCGLSASGPASSPSGPSQPGTYFTTLTQPLQATTILGG